MKDFGQKINVFMQEVFQFSLLTYLVLFLIETLKTGAVSAYFNMNILLGVVLVSGGVIVLTYSEKMPVQKATIEDVKNGFFLALLGGCGIYFVTSDLGYLAIVIAVLTGLTLFLFTVLLYIDEQ